MIMMKNSDKQNTTNLMKSVEKMIEFSSGKDYDEAEARCLAQFRLAYDKEYEEAEARCLIQVYEERNADMEKESAADEERISELEKEWQNQYLGMRLKELMVQFESDCRKQTTRATTPPIQLRAWALKQNKSFYGIARDLEISHSCFYNLMSGKSNPRKLTARRLLKITGIGGWTLAKLGRPRRQIVDQI